MADMDAIKEIVERFALELYDACMDSHQKGKEWERRFRADCEERGLHVEPSSARHDFVVQGSRVQCKCIDQVGDGWISICNMRPVRTNNNDRGYFLSEYEVLALKSRGDVFLIPAADIVDNTETGKLKDRIRTDFARHYLDNWDVFSAEFVPRNRQPTLF